MTNTILGNAIVGQSGGPTAAINATLAGVIRGMLKHKESTLYGMRNGIDGVLSDRLIDLSATFTDEAGNIREDDLDLLAHDVLEAGSGPAVGQLSHHRRGRDGVDCGNLGKGVGYMRRSRVTIHRNLFSFDCHVWINLLYVIKIFAKIE
jgi:hypothetical protein